MFKSEGLLGGSPFFCRRPIQSFTGRRLLSAIISRDDLLPFFLLPDRQHIVHGIPPHAEQHLNSFLIYRLCRWHFIHGMVQVKVDARDFRSLLSTWVKFFLPEREVEKNAVARRWPAAKCYRSTRKDKDEKKDSAHRL